MKKQAIVIWALLIAGFAAIEFPGILFINRIYPTIFGVPFIYGFSMVVWFFMCLLMYLGYRINWGWSDPTSKKNATNNKQ